ncbi:hypothetical protein [Vibrio sp. dhg]|uniref:hypothetical protein n=1 Tax=Vibrio sp. dhg TaxID=2163016 RepID=UPI000E536DFF|nr:hypothetical protein [Vibrio sp. dhg]AXT69665.1 hypothetical protein DBX26_00865 [Vibrio sp. dhg]
MNMVLKKSRLGINVQYVITFFVIFLIFTPYGNEIESGTTGIGILHDLLILSAMIFAILANKAKSIFPKEIVIHLLFFLIVIFCWIAYFGVDNITDVRSVCVSFVFCFLFIFSLPKKIDLTKCIELLIKVNLFLIYVQFFILIVFNKHVDLHQMLYPWSRDTYYPTFAGLVRLTGIHMEPGVYATILTGLNVLLAIHTYKPKLMYLTIISLLLTVSISGMIYAFILLLIVLIKNNSMIKYLLTSISLSIILTVTYFSPIGEYVQARSKRIESSTDYSVSYKQENIKYILERDIVDTLVGTGYRANECEKCNYINSNGFLFGTFFFHGVIGVMLIFLLYIYTFKIPISKVGILFIAFVSIQRYDLGYYFIWGLGIMNYILVKNEK